jgi:hypothetical protein
MTAKSKVSILRGSALSRLALRMTEKKQVEPKIPTERIA